VNSDAHIPCARTEGAMLVQFNKVSNESIPKFPKGIFRMNSARVIAFVLAISLACSQDVEVVHVGKFVTLLTCLSS
jgi:hypothetical protein